MQTVASDIAIVGAGIAGIATAFSLAKRDPRRRIVLVDAGAPMAFTSAQSGENYRDWWPHPVMAEFIGHSIDLMEAIARNTDNRIRMTRRGYLLATRHGEAEELISLLPAEHDAGAIRVHDTANAYIKPSEGRWDAAPEGVDVISGSELVQSLYPQFDASVSAIAHIRRAGDISGQQLGQVMLETLRESGLQLLRGGVEGIGCNGRFTLELAGGGRPKAVHSEVVVNAAGPFLGKIAAMLGTDLPVENVLQQKIAFEDRAGAIPRDAPFAVDLDAQDLDWTEEERAFLTKDETAARFADKLPGGIHCRPEGATWVKLGWAYNTEPGPPHWTPALDLHFPEIVLRGAARLQPALKAYYGKLPRPMSHYGGYYTMTRENWPLIGPMGPDGAFMVGALSGFGTMAACAAGSLCADWIADAERPSYAGSFTLARYDDRRLMRELNVQGSRGIL